MDKCVVTPTGTEHGFSATSSGILFPDDLKCHCGRWTWRELNEQDKEKERLEKYANQS